jgi:hypothetical protein
MSGLVLSPLTRWIAWPFGAAMALYVVLAVLAALQQAHRYRRPWHILFLPPCLFLYHLLHGMGVLWGLVLLSIDRAPVQGVQEPWPGAGQIPFVPISMRHLPRP